MKLSIVSALMAVGFAAQASCAALVAKSALDVFVLTIIKPDANSVWVVGQQELVTWDTSNAPVNISNEGLIALNKSHKQTFLAEGFDLRSGHEVVTVPTDTVPGTYTITLFGDSGNFSPQFPIIA
ncbi:hypothetical protein BDZ97DRAFT_1698862 [Flammula alnicola]|nr:hypothetical protein BDZ97DRAFT_1698862 [Flammula alnicola]